MADISSITLQDGTVYYLKDSAARQSIPSGSEAVPMSDDLTGFAG